MRNRRFVLYWLAAGISAIGTAMSGLAFPLLVLRATHSVVDMGSVTATQGLAALAAAVIAGPAADRFDRRALLVAADVGCGIVLCGVPLQDWKTGPSFAYLMVCAILSSGLASLWMITARAMLPSLVGRERILRANTWLAATTAAAQVLGPSLAGVISAAVSPALVVGLDGLTFLASGILLSFVRTHDPAQPPAEAVGPRGLRAMVAGYRAVWRVPLLFWMVLLNSMFFATCIAAVNLMIFYLKSALGKNDETVGLVFGIATLGAVAASFLVGPAARRVGFGIAWLGAMVVAALAFFCGVSGPGTFFATLIAIVFAAAQSASRLLVQSTQQELVPAHLMGRIGATFYVSSYAAISLANAGFTFAAARLGMPITFGLMGGTSLLLAASGLGTPIRRPPSSALQEHIEAAAR